MYRFVIRDASAKSRQYTLEDIAVWPFLRVCFCLWILVQTAPHAAVSGVLPDGKNAPLPLPAGDAGNGRTDDKADDGGWVRMEQGSRPAYVGIHGGTAPLSLLRSPEGDIFALTGNTGNDFSRILRHDIARNATKLSADAAAATFSPLQDENLRPFGLSNPPGLDAGAGAPLALESYPAEPDPLPAIKPLRLRSYLRALAYRGDM
jgi:hypothetical protein